MPNTLALTSSQIRDLLVYLDQEVSRCLKNSLSAMLGAVPIIEKISDAPPERIELWFRQKFEPAALGSIDFGLNRSGALATGHRLLAAAGLEAESDETAIETLGEILLQIGGGLASSFSGRLKREIIAKTMNPGGPPADAAHQFTYKISTSDGDVLYFRVVPQTSLLVELAPESLSNVPKNQVPSESMSVNTRNLELLLDVELPVSVSFGRAQLQLKDVIKLTTGSIVELNRSVSEPVDIIVNNCIIARGEVVVVEGNFGVRIKQIISKEDRLRSLS